MIKCNKHGVILRDDRIYAWCPYTGIEGAKAIEELQELYNNIPDLAIEEYCKDNNVEDNHKFTEEEDKKIDATEKLITHKLMKKYAWCMCKGASCPKACIKDIAEDYQNEFYALSCGFDNYPSHRYEKRFYE